MDEFLLLLTAEAQKTLRILYFSMPGGVGIEKIQSPSGNNAIVFLAEGSDGFLLPASHRQEKKLSSLRTLRLCGESRPVLQTLCVLCAFAVNGYEFFYGLGNVVNLFPGQLRIHR